MPLRQPFWISYFSQTSFIWHVVTFSTMLTQYGNNRSHSVVTMVLKRQMCHFYIDKWAVKKPRGGHFEFQISADLLPCDMSLYLAIFSPYIKTTGPTLWPTWWSTGKIVIFFIEKEAILNFQFSPNSFPAILSPIPTPMPNIKIICQHLQLVEREQKGIRTRCNNN